MSRTSRTLSNAKRAFEFERQYGRIGDANGSLRDIPNGRYWVRQITSSGGLSSPVSLRQKNGVHFRVYRNALVELGYDEKRELVIIGEASNLNQQQAINTFSSNLGDPAARGLLHQEELGNLFCRHSPSVAWSAQVLPGSTIIGTIYVELAVTTEMNLVSNVPSSGQHRYVAVFLKTDDTLTAVGSTAQSTTSPLDSTDIQEIIDATPANSTPLRAFVFDGDATDFDDSPLTAKDLRAPFGQTGSGTPGGGGSPSYPHQATLLADEFAVIAGTWVYISDGSQAYDYFYRNSSNTLNDKLSGGFFLAAGTYDLYVLSVPHATGGIMTIKIDGATVTIIDDYAASNVYNTPTHVSSVTVTGDGQHTMTIEITSKNGSSAGYRLQLTKVWLR